MGKEFDWIEETIQRSNPSNIVNTINSINKDWTSDRYRWRTDFESILNNVFLNQGVSYENKYWDCRIYWDSIRHNCDRKEFCYDRCYFYNKRCNEFCNYDYVEKINEYDSIRKYKSKKGESCLGFIFGLPAIFIFHGTKNTKIEISLFLGNINKLDSLDIQRYSIFKVIDNDSMLFSMKAAGSILDYCIAMDTYYESIMDGSSKLKLTISLNSEHKNIEILSSNTKARLAKLLDNNIGKWYSDIWNGIDSIIYYLNKFVIKYLKTNKESKMSIKISKLGSLQGYFMTDNIDDIKVNDIAFMFKIEHSKSGAILSYNYGSDIDEIRNGEFKPVTSDFIIKLIKILAF